MKLEDDSIMPFGKYKGKTMENVPVEYLHWFWGENRGTPSSQNAWDVKNYIEERLDALKMENRDLIW